ncbi:hypothetical protein D4764_05G0003820 [Takifugu flavidus]|uniref:Uncharacterized protein n=1 Tax=Takifugu flavidus TaxID=433684 RepID=A0A5C6MYQ7_9TELE|nr:hypothetical protein D4764_05G0003820 [Takifugu flavidus]
MSTIRKQRVYIRDPSSLLVCSQSATYRPITILQLNEGRKVPVWWFRPLFEGEARAQTASQTPNLMGMFVERRRNWRTPNTGQKRSWEQTRERGGCSQTVIPTITDTADGNCRHQDGKNAESV